MTNPTDTNQASEVLPEQGGSTVKECSYCGGTGTKIIAGKETVCISCLGEGEGDAW